MSNRGEKTVWTAEGKRQAEKLPESSDELKKFIKINDWNKAVLVARGNHVSFTVNGHLMTEMIDNDTRGRSNGVIGIQLHHGFVMEVQVKDIKIKFLGKEEKK